LAGVYSEVAAYEFTTLTTVPGVIRYKGAKIQLLDLPGIIEGAKDGKGRGKQVRSCVTDILFFNPCGECDQLVFYFNFAKNG
jgi:ribosome-interacting GTPase 1